jgi:hypothetical protein
MDRNDSIYNCSADGKIIVAPREHNGLYDFIDRAVDYLELSIEDLNNESQETKNLKEKINTLDLTENEKTIINIIFTKMYPTIAGELVSKFFDMRSCDIKKILDECGFLI